MSSPAARSKSAPVFSSELYAKLRRIARGYLAKERKNHTLVPTALVHEAYLRLANERSAKQAFQKNQIPALARLMREVLVNHATAKHRQKRGGARVQITFNEAVHLAGEAPEVIELIELDAALNLLQQEDPKLAQLVECRYFAGLTIPETAKAMGISPATVKRNWLFAKTWIYHAIEKNKK